MSVVRAIEDIREGKPILIYDFDDRERETDITIASEFITHDVIREMRKSGGGLLCTTTPYDVAKRLGLPFLSDVFAIAGAKNPLLKGMAPDDIPYDNTKSSFGLTINHRKTYTGITDYDRALTIREYARTIFQDKPDSEIINDLAHNFRAPGHVHLLNTSENILSTRKGHTELSTAMMIMAGVKPSATICEMMGDDGNSMKKEDCITYGKRMNYTFVTGDEIISAWNIFRGKK